MRLRIDNPAVVREQLVHSDKVRVKARGKVKARGDIPVVPRTHLIQITAIDLLVPKAAVVVVAARLMARTQGRRHDKARAQDQAAPHRHVLVVVIKGRVDMLAAHGIPVPHILVSHDRGHALALRDNARQSDEPRWSKRSQLVR